MSVGDTIIWGVAAAAVLVSLANPGGWVIGGLIAFVILGGRYGLPFLGDLYKERQRGVGRAKMEQRARDRVRQAKEYDPRDDERRGGRR